MSCRKTTAPSSRRNDAHAWLTVITEAANDAIIGIDLSGVITSWNKAAEVMFGDSAHDIVGRPMTIIYPPEELDDAIAILDRIRRGERLAGFETIRQRKDGIRIRVSLTTAPLRDDAERLVGVVKVVRDLGKAQHVQQDLQPNVAKRRSVRSSIPLGMLR